MSSMKSSTTSHPFPYQPTTVELNELIATALQKDNALDWQGVTEFMKKKKPRWDVPKNRMVKFVKRQKSTLGLETGDDDKSLFSMRSRSSRSTVNTKGGASTKAASVKSTGAKSSASSKKSATAASNKSDGVKNGASSTNSTANRSTPVRRNSTSSIKSDAKNKKTNGTSNAVRSASVKNVANGSKISNAMATNKKARSTNGIVSSTTPKKKAIGAKPVIRKKSLKFAEEKKPVSEDKDTDTEETDSNNSITRRDGLYEDDNDGKKEVCGCIASPLLVENVKGKMRRINDFLYTLSHN